MSRELSLALLTWKAPVTLEATLICLAPILDLFKDKLVVCQESDPEEMRLAERHGFRAIGLKDNVGIQNGLKRAVQECVNEHVLLLENDCMLNGSLDLARRQLQSVGDLIDAGLIEYARLSALPRRKKRRFEKYWRLSNNRLKRRPLGYLRYVTANATAAEVVCSDIDSDFESNYLKPGPDNLYITQSRYCHWSNRAIYVRKTFFLDRLIARAETHPTAHQVNGRPDLEHAINSYWRRGWWRAQGFRLAIAKPGLFGHRRFDRDASDEKWETGGAVEERAPVFQYSTIETNAAPVASP